MGNRKQIYQGGQRECSIQTDFALTSRRQRLTITDLVAKAAAETRCGFEGGLVLIHCGNKLVGISNSPIHLRQQIVNILLQNPKLALNSTNRFGIQIMF